MTQVGGLFWNYFSIGMDAKAAYGFHSLREKRPWAASGRAVNQAWYGYFSCSSGWFCAAPALRNKATLQASPAVTLSEAGSSQPVSLVAFTCEQACGQPGLVQLLQLQQRLVLRCTRPPQQGHAAGARPVLCQIR